MTREPQGVNRLVASRLDEVALLLEEQGANPFRVGAYRRAANVVRGLDRPVTDILQAEGLEGLEKLSGIGESLARAIHMVASTGRLPMLDRLRGASDPVALLMTIPGIGRSIAERLHDDLGIETLEDLEIAAHDGRLRQVAGIGEKRLAGIRDVLSSRLSRRLRRAPPTGEDQPPVSELLDVDREYRRRARAGTLRHIAPRRFNPTGASWLPVLHTQRKGHEYTALFSNTARAHRLGRTHDWVVLYQDGGRGERQYTVVTARQGRLQGERVVRGREPECERHYEESSRRRPSDPPPREPNGGEDSPGPLAGQLRSAG
jgi:DNA polymerase (family X)